MPEAKQPSPLAELRDTREAAAFLRLEPNTLDNWRSTGRYNLPFVKIGRKVFYRPSDLEKFLAERTFANTGQVPSVAAAGAAPKATRRSRQVPSVAAAGAAPKATRRSRQVQK